MPVQRIIVAAVLGIVLLGEGVVAAYHSWTSVKVAAPHIGSARLPEEQKHAQTPSAPLAATPSAGVRQAQRSRETQPVPASTSRDPQVELPRDTTLPKATYVPCKGVAQSSFMPCPATGEAYETRPAEITPYSRRPFAVVGRPSPVTNGRTHLASRTGMTALASGQETSPPFTAKPPIATNLPTATATATAVPTSTPHPTSTPDAQATATAQAEAVMLDRLTHSALQPQYISYTVQPGDTEASIARHFHDVAWLVRRRNGGLWNMAPGQIIRVWQWPFGAPFEVTHTYQIDHPQVYTIKPGDTAGGIATRLGTTLATLVSENNLGSANLIYPGQKLVVHHYTAYQQRMIIPGLPPESLHSGLLLTDVANLVGTDAALVKALSWHESGWRMVRGSSGEIGMMQIMPATALWIQRNLIGYDLDPSVQVNNVLEGTVLLQYYLDLHHGDTHAALALYHSGNTLANHRNGSYIQPISSLRRYFYRYPRAGW